MAKVMVSLPDELLASLDAEATRRGTTRSALLRSYVEEVKQLRTQLRIARMQELTSNPGHHGGNSAELVKLHRPELP